METKVQLLRTYLCLSTVRPKYDECRTPLWLSRLHLIFLLKDMLKSQDSFTSGLVKWSCAEKFLKPDFQLDKQLKLSKSVFSFIERGSWLRRPLPAVKSSGPRPLIYWNGIQRFLTLLLILLLFGKLLDFPTLREKDAFLTLFLLYLYIGNPGDTFIKAKSSLITWLTLKTSSMNHSFLTSIYWAPTAWEGWTRPWRCS